MAAAPRLSGNSVYTLLPNGAAQYSALPSGAAQYSALPSGASFANASYVALNESPLAAAYAPINNAKSIEGLYIVPPPPKTSGIYTYDNGKGHAGISNFIMPDGITFNDFVKSEAFKKHTYLGHGFFSSAYLLSFSSGQKFVLKVADRNYVRSYVEGEAEVLAALANNKYVNKLLVAQIEPSISYILIEYVPGQTLEAWISSKPSTELRTTIKAELRAGIDSIHAAGFVHTDIKPDNIWIPEDRSRPAMYIDFGLAEPIGTVRKSKSGRVTTINPSINNNAIDNMFRLFGGKRKTRKVARRRL